MSKQNKYNVSEACAARIAKTVLAAMAADTNGFIMHGGATEALLSALREERIYHPRSQAPELVARWIRDCRDDKRLMWFCAAWVRDYANAAEETRKHARCVLSGISGLHECLDDDGVKR